MLDVRFKGKILLSVSVINSLGDDHICFFFLCDKYENIF